MSHSSSSSSGSSNSSSSGSSSSDSSSDEEKISKSPQTRRRSPSQDDNRLSERTSLPDSKKVDERGDQISPRHDRRKAAEKADDVSENGDVIDVRGGFESESSGSRSPTPPARFRSAVHKVTSSSKREKEAGQYTDSDSDFNDQIPQQLRRRSRSRSRSSRDRDRSRSRSRGERHRSRSRSDSRDRGRGRRERSRGERRSREQRRTGPINQLDVPGRNRSESAERQRSPRRRSHDDDRNSRNRKHYRVEWERGKGDDPLSERRRRRQERHERQGRLDDRDRDAELERRRRERERRHAEQQQHRRDDNDDDDVMNRSDKRKRSSSPRAPPEEGEITEPANEADLDYLRAKKKRTENQDDALTTKTGGAYIPPARLRLMQAGITDKSSQQFQRLAWEALKKSINGLINKVNVANIVTIVKELLAENIVRGRGLLARAVITAQTASPTFTHVYAALVAILNTKFPQVGELILKRLMLQFKKSFRRNDKAACVASVRFIAHLVNQQVAHEIVALETLFLLLQNASDDSVEVAIAFLQEVGQKLASISPKAIVGVFERLRNVLHEAQIEKRTQYMIEVMFQVRKDGFKDHPAVLEELDLVSDDEQFTHSLHLEDAVNGEEMLNVFKFDAEYEQNEEKYKELKRDILDEGSSDSDGDGGSDSDSSDDSDDDDADKKASEQQILDMTETNLVGFRRTVYLTIQSSLDFEECAHKLLRMDIKPGWEMELCNMMLDCCGQQRTYEKFFGLLAQRFCMLDRKYVQPFQTIFQEQYATVHRLETNKLRNVGKFFSHLLHTDAISWQVLEVIRLNEDDTTSSSRIFIKVLFQDLSEYMGLSKLNDRLIDPTLSMCFEGLFPRDNPRNTRFAINFFTSIGLGGLTDELRAHLKTMPKQVPRALQVQEEEEESSSSSSSSSDSDSSSSSSDSSSSSSSEDDASKKRRRKKAAAAKVKVKKDADRTASSSKRRRTNTDVGHASYRDKDRQRRRRRNDDDDDDVRAPRARADRDSEYEAMLNDYKQEQQQRKKKLKTKQQREMTTKNRGRRDESSSSSSSSDSDSDSSSSDDSSDDATKKHKAVRSEVTRKPLPELALENASRRKDDLGNHSRRDEDRSRRRRGDDESRRDDDENYSRRNNEGSRSRRDDDGSRRRKDRKDDENERRKRAAKRGDDGSRGDADRYRDADGDAARHERKRRRRQSSSGIEFVDVNGKVGKAKGRKRLDERESLEQKRVDERQRTSDHMNGDANRKQSSKRRTKSSANPGRVSDSESDVEPRKRREKTPKAKARKRHDSSENESESDVDKENRYDRVDEKRGGDKISEKKRSRGYGSVERMSVGREVRRRSRDRR